MDIKNDDPLRVVLPPDEEIPAGLSGATATIFLSITLILITYFVYLNAVGKPAHHLADQVAASVRESFRGSVQPVPESLQEKSILQKFSDLQGQIQKFGEPLRLSSIVSQHNDRIEVQFNPEEIFLEDGEIKASAIEPLSGILGAIAAAGLPLSLDIGYSADPSGSEERAQSFIAAANRASALIRLFVDRDGKIENVSGGGRLTTERLPVARLLVLYPEIESPALRRQGW